jgi:hypothetical protein
VEQAYVYSGKPKADHSAKYFSHSDEQASKVREQLAEESLESLISWLKSEGNVGIMGELSQPCPMCKLTYQTRQIVHLNADAGSENE